MAIFAAVFSYLRGREVFHHTVEAVQVSVRNPTNVIEQVNTPDPVGGKTINGANGNTTDIRSDPVLRKIYAAYLLMNTELGETVLNSITGRELIYTIAVASGLPNWFIDFVNNINDCQFNNSTIEVLIKHVNMPDWLSEVVNGWLKVKSEGRN